MFVVCLLMFQSAMVDFFIRQRVFMLYKKSLIFQAVNVSRYMYFQIINAVVLYHDLCV